MDVGKEIVKGVTYFVVGVALAIWANDQRIRAVAAPAGTAQLASGVGNDSREPPRPVTTEYLITTLAGFIRKPDSNAPTEEIPQAYVVTYKIVKPFPKNVRAEFEFENPENPASPIKITKTVAATEKDIYAESPNVHGMKVGKIYRIMLRIYDEDDPSKLITEHLQPVQAPTLEQAEIAKAVQQCEESKSADPIIESCTAAIQSLPEHKGVAELYSLRGFAFYLKNEHDRAIEDFDQAVRIDPTKARAFYGRGLSYYAKRQYDRAIQSYSEAIRLEPKNALYLSSRGEAYGNFGQYDKAIADHNNAVDLGDKSARNFTHLGNAYAAEGQFDSAVLDYDQALSLDPQYQDALFARGRAKFLAARFDDSARDFEQSIQLVQTDPYRILWLHMARARGKQDDAAEFNRNAAKLNLDVWPGPIVALFFNRMNAKQALASAKKADPNGRRGTVCEASFFLGEGALIEGRVKEAGGLLRQAQEICPVDFIERVSALAELQRLPGGRKRN